MNGLVSLGKGSRRRGRQPGELTYKSLCCRQYRCNQLGVDNKDAKTRHPPKHRKLHEEFGRPHRVVVKKEQAPRPKKEKKEEYVSGMKAGTYLGRLEGYYKYRCPYCLRVNSFFVLEPRTNCHYCYGAFTT